MTLFSQTQGRRETQGKVLNSTAEFTLLDPPKSAVVTLESVSICNPTASPIDFNLTWNEGTTAFTILNEIEIAADSTTIIDNHHVTVQKTQTLKAQGSAAGLVLVYVIVRSHPSQK